MKKKNTSLDHKFKEMLDSAKAYAAGKTALRTTIMTSDGSREIFWESLPEARAREIRQTQFKSMRADLGLTQDRMAAAMRVSVNTLKGWEAGKPIPAIAFVLAELLHDIPGVRKRLLAA